MDLDFVYKFVNFPYRKIENPFKPDISMGKLYGILPGLCVFTVEILCEKNVIVA